MSHYANELKEATCYINSNDFEEARIAIQECVRRGDWQCYGWYNVVLKAKTFEDLLGEFDIKLEPVYGNYYRPVICDVYVSMFFPTLISIMEDYMTKGKIVVDDEYNIVTIKFKDGNYDIKEKGRYEV